MAHRSGRTDSPFMGAPQAAERRRTFSAVVQAEEARPVPVRPGDRPGRLGEAPVEHTLPGEAVLRHHDLVEHALVLSHEHGAWLERGFGGDRRTAALLPVACSRAMRWRNLIVSRSRSPSAFAWIRYAMMRRRRYLGTCGGAVLRNSSRHRTRSPCRSRSASAAISRESAPAASSVGWRVGGRVPGPLAVEGVHQQPPQSASAAGLASPAARFPPSMRYAVFPSSLLLLASA
jgi:hypothetical protein